MTWLQQNWRAILARLPLPMLALAASWGVYSFAALYVPQPIAIIQAAAFELTYIGLAVARSLDDRQRRRATAISLGAVIVSVLYNSIDGLFARNPTWLIGLPPGAEIGGAVLHGAPLAIVAYLVADLLLHSAPRQSSRPRQLRALVHRLVRLLRTARTELRSVGAMLTQVRAELHERDLTLVQMQAATAQLRADLEAQIGELAQWRERAAQDADAAAQWRASAERASDEAAHARAAEERTQRLVAQQEQEIAQLRAAAAQPIVIDGIDLLAIARRLRDEGVPSREAAQLVGLAESTLRSRLGKAATNGTHG